MMRKISRKKNTHPPTDPPKTTADEENPIARADEENLTIKNAPQGRLMRKHS